MDTEHAFSYMIYMVAQLSLFGHGPPRFETSLEQFERQRLSDHAWVLHRPGFVDGHESLFNWIRDNTQWQAQRRQMYEREVDVPRLVATFPADGPIHPTLIEISSVLSQHFAWPLTNIAAAYYRDGRDSVAMHGDKLGNLVHDSVIGIVSLGEPRRFLLKERSGKGSRQFNLGWGDLLVMGGDCQSTWLHGIPKAVVAGPRISVQFRPSLEH